MTIRRKLNDVPTLDIWQLSRDIRLLERTTRDHYSLSAGCVSAQRLLAGVISAVRDKGVFHIASEDVFDSSEDSVIHLTDREIEVLRLILEGKSSKEASTALCCSKRTVDFHLARIYQKLDVSNRVQAMRRVALLGLIPIGVGEDGDDGRYS